MEMKALNFTSLIACYKVDLFLSMSNSPKANDLIVVHGISNGDIIVHAYKVERLSKHFGNEGTDWEAWDRRQVLFLPGGQRQLYGYMAEKEDLDIFNQHFPALSLSHIESIFGVVSLQVCRI